MKEILVLLAALVSASSCAQAKSPDPLLPKLERLAEHGNAEAQYHLGMAYWVGEGVDKDVSKAVAYFEHAAANGDPLGAYKLGCLYDGQDRIMDRDAAKALTFKLVAANAGYALAQQDVASLYAERSEYDLALKWLEKAARQGTTGALMAYASVHNGAPGITPDPVITAAYFRLYLDRAEGSDKQRDWLQTFEKKLTPEQREAVSKTVAAYRPMPTPLTLKALRGVESAKELVQGN
jgi:TPR repeat protein